MPVKSLPRFEKLGLLGLLRIAISPSNICLSPLSICISSKKSVKLMAVDYTIVMKAAGAAAQTGAARRVHLSRVRLCVSVLREGRFSINAYQYQPAKICMGCAEYICYLIVNFFLTRNIETDSKSLILNSGYSLRN